MKDLSIIIVNYNTPDLVQDCVSSIKSSKTKLNYEIIVVDNGSDKRPSKLKDCTLIVNKENLGFAKANNQGLEIAKGKHILVLNSDTLVEEGALDMLFSFAENTGDAGVVGPRLLNKDGSLQKSCFNFPSIKNAILEFWFNKKGAYQKFAPETTNPVAVDAVVGAAFLITQKAKKRVGKLNEKYFMYFEDLDYCRKVKKAGLKTYYLPQAQIVHYHGASGKKLKKASDQWKRLIPASKIYHGTVKHYLLSAIIWSGQRFSSYLPFFLVLVITIPAFWHLLKPGFFPMQDDLQAFRVQQLDKCLDDLQIPCRWVPDAGYQYGYPQFNYYPPLPYYVGAILHRVGLQYIDVVKVLFILGYIFSAYAIYVLVSEIANKWSGFVVSILYTYIPYKAVEVYVRGALNEFWAQIFFPLILWSIYKIVKSGSNKYLILLGISLALLSTTHLLMTLIFIPVTAIWALYWLKVGEGKNLKKLILGGLLSIGLSAFFVFPVIFEKRFAHVESMLSGYFDYRQHFISLYKMFLSREWGYGSSGFPDELLNLSLGLVQWIAALGATVIAFIKFRGDRKTSSLVLLLSVTTLASIFMMHMKSSFIWANLPVLWYLQFPWRFLAVSIFLTCILSGFLIYFIKRYRYLIGVFLIILAFVLNISYFVPKDWYYISDEEKFSGVFWEKQLTISIFDYLPIYATLPPPSKAPELPEVLEGEVVFESYNKRSNYQYGEVEVLEEALVRVPLFDFPGMVVTAGGNKIVHWNDECRHEPYCLGLITFRLPPGKYDLNIALQNTPVRSVGNFLTIFTLLILVIYAYRQKRNEKLANQ